MKAAKFTRQEMYDLAWSESLVSVSKKYDASYHELRKICGEMNIPLPKAGYWQNLWLGRKMDKRTLPVEHAGKEEIVLNLLEEGDERTKRNKSSTLSAQELNEDKEEETMIAVPTKLLKPHKLIVAAKADWEKRNYLDRGLVFPSRDVLDISVAPVNLNRALRFMDTFIKTQEEKGNSVIIENGESFAIVSGEKIKICFRERLNRTMIDDGSSYPSAKYTPTGLLYFKIRILHKDTEWVDKKKLVEEQLSDIIAAIDEKAMAHKLLMLEWEKSWKRQEEERRLIHEFEKKAQQDKANFNKLLNDSQKWQQANILNLYISELEARAKANNSVSDDFKQWLSWARQKTEEYNPLNNIF